MTLALDTRQRAMLAEMGVRVWLPLPDAAPSANQALTESVRSQARGWASPSPQAHDHPGHAAQRGFAADAQGARQHPPAARGQRAALPAAPAATAPPPATAPVALQPLPDLAALDWPALQAAAQHCQACGLCAGRQHSVWDAAGAALANPPAAAGLPRWLFVTDPPGAAENASGQALQGDPGVLLANMAAALRLQPAQVYRSHASKCAPPGGRNAALDELQHCAAYLQREIALIQPQVIVALGRNAAYGLLQRTEPLGQLRGQPFSVVVDGCSVPVIVSYPLAYLLRNPAAKAQAWLDLGRALVALDAPAAPLQ